MRNWLALLVSKRQLMCLSCDADEGELVSTPPSADGGHDGGRRGESEQSVGRDAAKRYRGAADDARGSYLLIRQRARARLHWARHSQRGSRLLSRKKKKRADAGVLAKGSRALRLRRAQKEKAGQRYCTGSRSANSPGDEFLADEFLRRTP